MINSFSIACRLIILLCISQESLLGTQKCLDFKRWHIAHSSSTFDKRSLSEMVWPQNDGAADKLDNKHFENFLVVTAKSVECSLVKKDQITQSTERIVAFLRVVEPSYYHFVQKCN